MLDRTIKKSNVVSPLKGILNLGNVEENEGTQIIGKDKRKNPKAYERYRGKAENQESTKAMSYYLTDLQIKAIALHLIQPTTVCKDKSAVVRAALNSYLATEIEYLSQE